MTLPRRLFLQLAAGAATLSAPCRMAWAQAYPTRPVRIVASAPPGGNYDLVARLLAQQLSERLGQPFIVDNRPGGGTNIGTEAVVRAPADGYTLLVIGPPAAINATLYDKLSFNFLQDIAPIAAVFRVPHIVVVQPTFPARTIPELIAYAEDARGKVNVASAGTGTTPHLAAELLKAMADVDFVHVPYRGEGPAITDLLGGQVQVMFASASASIEQVRAGKLRPLAVTTATRWDGLPDIPTVAEFVTGYEVSAWFGMGAPKNTPAEIVDRLNKEINAGLADPQIKAQLAALGGTTIAGSPAEFGKLIADETEKWGKVIRAAKIKAE